MGGVQLIPYCATFRLLQMASSESFQGSKRHNPIPPYPTLSHPPSLIQNRWPLHSRNMLSFHANVAPSAPAVLDVCWHVNCGFNPRAGKYLLLYADAAMANAAAADIPSNGVKKKRLPTTASAFANAKQVQGNPELEEGSSFFFLFSFSFFLKRHISLRTQRPALPIKSPRARG